MSGTAEAKAPYPAGAPARRAARVEHGELVQVADFALPQARGGVGGGEVPAGHGGEDSFEVVHNLPVRV